MCILIGLSLARFAQGTTYTYNRSASGTDQWSTGGNWDATPVSAANTTLTIGIPAAQLAAGSTIFTNNDFAGDFMLNRLNFTYGSASLSPRPVVTISGNRLEFVSDGATTPVLNIDPSGVPDSILVISNPLLLTNNLTIINMSDSLSPSANLSGVISGGGSLSNTSFGTLTLSGANTYSGGTILSGGTLFINNGGSGGTSSAIGTGTFTINGPVAISNNSANSVTVSTNNTQIWASDFSFYAPTGTRDLNLGSGAVTMTANRIINVGGFDGFPNQATLTVGGAIGDGGSGFSLTKEQFGTLILTGASTYSGGTFIAKGAINTSIIGNAGAPGLGTGGITIGGAGSETATLRYIGMGETTDKVITLAGSGIREIDRTATSAGLLKFTSDLVVSGAGPLTLALVTNGSAPSEFAGRITGNNVSIVVDDIGTWALSGANTFTTKVTINSGTLSVSSLNSVVGGSASSNLGAPTTVAEGTIDFGGGPNIPSASVHSASILQYTGAGETTDRVLNVKNGSGNIIEHAGTGVLKFTSDLAATGTQDLGLAGSTSGTGEFAGVIGNSAGFGTTSVSKFGTGTWTLSAANTYTGTTRVFGGTLLLNGDQSAATGDVTVFITQTPGVFGTLGGTGTIGGSVTLNGGTITAADIGSVGILTLNGNATFVGAFLCTSCDRPDVTLTLARPDDEFVLATYVVDLSGALSDKLVIGGTLNLNDANDQITFNGTPDGTSTYVLATYTSVSGTFDFGSAPSGYQLLYDTNQLLLAPVPEPGILTLSVFGVVTLILLAHRSRQSR